MFPVSCVTVVCSCRWPSHAVSVALHVPVCLPVSDPPPLITPYQSSGGGGGHSPVCELHHCLIQVFLFLSKMPLNIQSFWILLHIPDENFYLSSPCSSSSSSSSVEMRWRSFESEGLEVLTCVSALCAASPELSCSCNKVHSEGSFLFWL